MTYLVVASWDDVTKVVTAEARADNLAEADAKVAGMVSEGYTKAFHVLTPEGSSDYWVVNEAAKTVANDQAQADADALERSWDRLRTERNALLVSSDWTQSTDTQLSDEDKASWATYRQELRDLPANSPDPADPTWPDAPA